jgi:hypothetical protein
MPVKYSSIAVDVKLSPDRLIVILADGRELAAPLAWFPRLLDASQDQRVIGD